MNKSGALLEAGNTILRDMAEQKITPEQGKSLMEILGAYRENILMDHLMNQLMQQIHEIEAKLDHSGNSNQKCI